MRFRPPAFVAVCLALAITARAGEDGSETLFAEKVWPVLEQQCVKCHGAEKQKGGLRLDSRDAALRGGDSGPSIVPGNAGESLLVKLVHHADLDRTMPPKEKLKDADIAVLEQWIESGAPWPENFAVTDSVGAAGSTARRGCLE